LDFCRFVHDKECSKVLNRSPFRTSGLFVIAGMLSGCSWLWSWPDIRLVENMEGLGTGQIADYIRKESSARGAANLEAQIAKFIVRSIPKKGLSREDAESLGMTCAAAPSTECTYSGEFWSRTDRLPPGSRHYGMRTIFNIQIHLSYLKPRELVVQVREHDIPDE
jgi:hypothetical protein